MAIAWRVLLVVFVASLAWDSAAGKGPLAASGKASQPAKTVSALRARGPEGLDEALRTYDKLQAEYAVLQGEENGLHSAVLWGDGDKNPDVEAALEKAHQRVVDMERRIERTAAAIDQIGSQRSCTVSRLYWYTDLEQAKQAAARTGRPILSLRMLGKLTDEYSCANSRFFRTALYSNKVVSDFLRTNFVLHWKSVRPVPRVTIDFGDGRKLERTLTGNSAHYVLASTGQPLDVLPGLYSPQRFLIWLRTTRGLHAEYVAGSESDRPALLQRHHLSRRDALLRQWDLDIQRLGEGKVTLVSSRIYGAIEAARPAGHEVRARVPAPDARLGARQAASKSVAEVPVLRFANMGGQWMEKGMDDDLWRAIANLHRGNVKLDEASVALMRREFPLAADAGRISVSKMRQEDPVLRMVRVFEGSMTLDTVRNEYLLHRRIHEQFADGVATTADFNALNEWVYAELFLTPSSDPWLGLAPRDVYTALEGDGRAEPTTEVASRGG
ncbi:MAG: thioredoxin family protein [Planctomycetes bacterium]|nr:thioredoxin family protein [Planctomycetota bacterium]